MCDKRRIHTVSRASYVLVRPGGIPAPTRAPGEALLPRSWQRYECPGASGVGLAWQSGLSLSRLARLAIEPMPSLMGASARYADGHSDRRGAARGCRSATRADPGRVPVPSCVNGLRKRGCRDATTVRFTETGASAAAPTANVVPFQRQSSPPLVREALALVRPAKHDAVRATSIRSPRRAGNGPGIPKVLLAGRAAAYPSSPSIHPTLE